MTDKRQWRSTGTVNIKVSPLESKGWITFSAGGENKSRAWNRTIPEGLKQDLIEDLAVNAMVLGYGRDMDLRMHPDDYLAYTGGVELQRVVV